MEGRGEDVEEWRLDLEARAKAKIGRREERVEGSDRLVHDLNVHRIELELQNEELIRSQSEGERTIEHYRALLAAAPLGCLTVDKAGRVRDVNPMGAALLGHEVVEVVNRHLQRFLPVSDADRFHHYLRECLSTEMAQTFDLALGERAKPVHLRLQIIPATVVAAEGPTCWIFLTDLSSQIESNQRLGEQKIELARRVAEGIANRYDRLLTILSLGTDALLRRKSAMGLHRDEIAANEEAIKQAKHLSTRLHGLSGLPAAQVETPDAAVIVTEMVTSLRELFPERISLTTKPSAQRCSVTATRRDLEMVVFHLCVYALEVNPSTWQARLRLSRGEHGWDSLADVGNGPYLKLSLTSKLGAGDRNESRPRIDHGNPELASLFAIVNRCGGIFDACEDPGNDPRIDIYLPLQPELRLEESSGAEGAYPLERHADRCKSIDERIVLLVDDETMLLTAVSKILSLEGYHVIAVASGEEALAVATTSGQQLDLLLSDVRMPGMSGGELGQQMATLRPDVPRIYMSGDLGNVALEPGATVVAKPFQPESLLSLVKAHLPSR